MKFYLSLLVLAVGLFMAAGCIHLPSTDFSAAPGPSQVSQSLIHNVSPGAIGKTPARDASPATKAIQTTFNIVATVSIVGGLACLAFGALAIYNTHIPTGIKLILSGIALPVVGIWFAYHWGLVILALFSVAALYFLYEYWGKARPVLKAAENVAGNIVVLAEHQLGKAPLISGLCAPSEPTPPPPSTPNQPPV
jgi:hypothetical protein